MACDSRRPVDRLPDGGRRVAHHEGRPAQGRDGHRVVLTIVESIELHDLATQDLGPLLGTTVADRQDRPRPDGSCFTASIAQIAVAGHDLIDVRQLDRFGLVIDEGHVAEVEQRVDDTHFVVGGLGEAQLFLVPEPRVGQIGLPVGEAAGGRCRQRTSLGVSARGRHGQGGFGQPAPLRAEPEGVPEPPQAAGDAQGEVRFARVDRPALGRPQVRDVRSDPVEDLGVPGRVQISDTRRGKGKERLGVTPSDIRLVAVVREAGQRERLDRAQHPEAGSATGFGDRDDQAPVGELEQVVQAVRCPSWVRPSPRPARGRSRRRRRPVRGAGAGDRDRAGRGSRPPPTRACVAGWVDPGHPGRAAAGGRRGGHAGRPAGAPRCGPPRARSRAGGRPAACRPPPRSGGPGRVPSRAGPPGPARRTDAGRRRPVTGQGTRARRRRAGEPGS